MRHIGSALINPARSGLLSKPFSGRKLAILKRHSIALHKHRPAYLPNPAVVGTISIKVKHEYFKEVFAPAILSFILPGVTATGSAASHGPSVDESIFFKAPSGLSPLVLVGRNLIAWVRRCAFPAPKKQFLLRCVMPIHSLVNKGHPGRCPCNASQSSDPKKPSHYHLMLLPAMSIGRQYSEIATQFLNHWAISRNPHAIRRAPDFDTYYRTQRRVDHRLVRRPQGRSKSSNTDEAVPC
jgi:hypothetical protein